MYRLAMFYRLSPVSSQVVKNAVLAHSVAQFILCDIEYVLSLFSIGCDEEAFEKSPSIVSVSSGSNLFG